MDFRELRYFSYVADTKSFSRAAEALGIAQPAISRCVSLLEAELGVVLFKRHGRGVTLTDAGQTLYERATGLLHGLRQAREDVVNTSAEPKGSIRLAVPPATGQVLVPPVVERYRSLYPQVALHIHEGFSGYMNEWLLSGRVDVAVIHNPIPHKSLEIQHLLTDRIYVVVPGPNSEGRKHWKPVKSYSVKDLTKLPLILPGRPHSLRLLAERTVARTGGNLNIVLEADGLPTIRSLIMRGLGVTVLAYVAITTEVASGMLSAIPLRPAIHWGLDIASHRERNRTAAAQRLIELIDQEVKGLVRNGTWKGSHVIEN